MPTVGEPKAQTVQTPYFLVLHQQAVGVEMVFPALMALVVAQEVLQQGRMVVQAAQ
jgi:hypothetical protein